MLVATLKTPPPSLLSRPLNAFFHQSALRLQRFIESFE